VKKEYLLGLPNEKDGNRPQPRTPKPNVKPAPQKPRKK